MDTLKRGVSQTSEGELLHDYGLLESMLTLRARIDSLINSIGRKLKALKVRLKEYEPDKNLFEGNTSIMETISVVVGTFPNVNQISIILPSDLPAIKVRLQESFDQLKLVHYLIQDFEKTLEE